MIKKFLLVFSMIVVIFLVGAVIFSKQSGTGKSNEAAKTVSQDGASGGEKNSASGNANDGSNFIPNAVATDHLLIKVNPDFNISTGLNPYFPKLKNDSVSELIFQNENGSLQKSEDILKSSNIIIPGNILSGARLKTYIFKKESDIGVSEAIVIENQKKTDENKQMMLDWEKNMIYDLHNFVLIGEKYDLVKASGNQTFSDSYYRNGRFINFTKGGYVTLDYLVVDGYIIIGNSMSILNEVASKVYESKYLSK